MNERRREQALQSAGPPDTLFALVAGVYVAAMLSPAVVLALELWVTRRSSVLYLATVVAGTGILGVTAWGVTRWRGLPERLGPNPYKWGLALVPGVVAAGYLAVPAVAGDAGKASAIVAMPLAAVGVLAGTGLAPMARNRYTRALVDDGMVSCEWEAIWPKSLRRRFTSLFAGSVCLLVVSVAVDVRFGVTWPSIVALVLLVPTGTLFRASVESGGYSRPYRASPVGLERRYAMSRFVYDWNRFESYSVTDEAIVVRWQSWWRPALQWSREYMDDPEAVERALAQHLPET